LRLPLARRVFLASGQPYSDIAFFPLFFHWLIPTTIATTSAANPSTDPTTVPAIEASSERCWRGSVGDDVDDVNDGGDCVVAVPVRVALEVEVDEVDRESIVENEVDDVNDGGDCVVAVPVRVALEVEVDEVDRESVVENEVDDDEVLSAIHLETQC
jgi:hypothetical protein